MLKVKEYDVVLGEPGQQRRERTSLLELRLPTPESSFQWYVPLRGQTITDLRIIEEGGQRNFVTWRSREQTIWVCEITGSRGIAEALSLHYEGPIPAYATRIPYGVSARLANALSHIRTARGHLPAWAVDGSGEPPAGQGGRQGTVAVVRDASGERSLAPRHMVVSRSTSACAAAVRRGRAGRRKDSQARR